MTEYRVILLTANFSICRLACHCWCSHKLVQYPPSGGSLAPAVSDGFPRLGEQNYSGGSGQLGADLAARFLPKVIAKIENLEFVEMSDLLQEAWASDAAGYSSSSIVKHLGRRPPVSDILVWAECSQQWQQCCSKNTR